PPSGDVPLQGPADTGRDRGMAPADLLENRHRADAGCGLEHRHNLAVPHAGERVRAAAPTGLVLLRWQPRIGFNPIGGSSGKPGLRGGDRRGIALTGPHVQPPLAVGDVARCLAYRSRPSVSAIDDARPKRSPATNIATLTAVRLPLMALL